MTKDEALEIIFTSPQYRELMDALANDMEITRRPEGRRVKGDM
jgi:hypothetical protein